MIAVTIVHPPSPDGQPPTPYYIDPTVTVHHGDCLDVLRSLPDASVDAVCTDPPYGLGFMGREWDALPPGVPFAAECLRVLKPGGHMLAFGGTRTWHRLACAVEDAGFEIRDSIAWMYGSGFPKSLDVSKAIDKAAGAEREVVGSKLGQPGYADTPTTGRMLPTLVEGGARGYLDITAPATPDAERWQGWGTALKPAFEPVVVARKPLAGTVAANVLAHGTGALNVDGCRTATGDKLGGGASTKGSASHAEGWDRPWKNDPEAVAAHAERVAANVVKAEALGRWPANVILDESQAEVLDEQSGEQRDGVAVNRNRTHGEKPNTIYEGGWQNLHDDVTFGGSGGASRFYYVAKADASERVRVDGIAHPTVKPLALMRWLVRLVTPPGGTVLEPFAGSGTTVEACILEGFHCIAIEREADYLPLIKQRIHRRRDPVEAVKAAGEDGGLFDLLDGGAS